MIELFTDCRQKKDHLGIVESFNERDSPIREDRAVCLF